MVLFSDKLSPAGTNGLGKPAADMPRDQPAVTPQMFAPEFISKPKPANVEEGCAASFSCAVEASPAASVSWEKDGKPVMEDERIQASSSQTRNSSLNVSFSRKYI